MSESVVTRTIRDWTPDRYSLQQLTIDLCEAVHEHGYQAVFDVLMEVHTRIVPSSGSQQFDPPKPGTADHLAEAMRTARLWGWRV